MRYAYTYTGTYDDSEYTVVGVEGDLVSVDTDPEAITRLTALGLVEAVSTEEESE